MVISKNVSNSLPHLATHLISKIPPMEFQNLQVVYHLLISIVAVFAKEILITDIF
jgi:hypothetical protein